MKNMKYLAEIKVMPHKELLDPQGKAVNNGLHKMQLHLEAASKEDAENQTREACEKLLVNKIMEQYSYTLSPLDT
jgi:phosphoribosylformylglycinamidine synthase